MSSETWFAVDVEADGPTPMLNSMVSFGAVPVGRHAELQFYGKVRPIHEAWVPEALAVSGFTREETLGFDDPADVMRDFVDWVERTTVGKRVFVSDNPSFDWQWINGYCLAYAGRNPFGHSARRIGDLYAGMTSSTARGGEWRKLSKTPHTHHPVDDARGVAEALVAMKGMGLRTPF